MADIEVEGPDGAVITFPEGTTPDVMTAAMQKHYGAPTPAPQGLWANVKDQAGKAAQAADDIVRLTANGMTLGYADKLAAAGNGDTVDQERALSQAAMDRAGSAGKVAEIGGTMVPAGVIGKAFGALGAGVEAVPAIGKAFTNPWANALMTGAATGAGDAAGHDQDIGTGAAVGAASGVGGKAVGDVLAAGVGKAAGLFNRAPDVPTSSALKQSARDAYKAADDAGVIVSPDATQRLAKALQGDAADFGYSPHMQPRARAVFDEIGNVDGQNVTLKGLDTLRKVAGRMKEGDPSEGALGSRFTSKIDDFVKGLQPDDVVAGDAQGGVDALTQARSLWQRSAKSDDLEEALQKAQLRAGSTGSGGNVNNATRQNVRRLLESRENWTPDERAAMVDVVKGTPTQNAARLLGKASPEGNGLMMLGHIGAAAVDPHMLAATLASTAAKRYADKATESSVQRLAELLRSGGDAAALKPTPNMVQRLAQSKREALARALMAGGVTSLVPNGAQ